jgi:VPDSG-CTERM motif
MKKFLACALLALTLAFNVNAYAQQRPQNGGGSTPRVSVPDNGSTAVLLGLSALALVAFHRRKKASV